MVYINVSELKNDIASLETLLEEYETTKANLFNQLKNSTMSWQDGNSVAFEEKILDEKKETNLYFHSLKEKKKIINYIYTKYSEIGNKIKCNLNSRQTLINLIDSCYNQANSIIQSFNNIDRSFYYSEIYSINIQRDKIIVVRNNLLEFKKNIIWLLNRIEAIEDSVRDRITQLESIKINEFDYNLV